MKKFLIYALTIAVLFTVSVFLYSEVVSGIKVVKTFGDVTGQKTAQPVWNKINQNDVLAVNDSIKTGIDSYAEMELNPGNNIRLKEKSQMLVKDLEAESKDSNGQVVKLIDFNLIEGDLALKLDKLPKDTLLQVSSPTAIAGARGTVFNVKYDSQGKMTDVGVIDSKVQVASMGEPNKFVEVSQYKKVSVAPWALATPKVRGSGILSEKILGKQFVESVSTPVLEVIGIGETEEKAKDNAFYNIAKRIMNISISPDKRIEDMLNDNPLLCQPLYTYIAKAEIVSSKKNEGKIEIVTRLPLAPVGDIIGKALPQFPSVVKLITMKEYGDKFGAQARVTTQRAAQLDGYKKLAEIIYKTVINSQTTLKDMEIKDDRITTTVEGVVKGAEILDTQHFSDGSITVVMAIRADLVMSEVAKITGDIFGTNYFTSPVVIDIDDFLRAETK
jgi:hypothetical protein